MRAVTTDEVDGNEASTDDEEAKHLDLPIEIEGLREDDIETLSIPPRLKALKEGVHPAPALLPPVVNNIV